MPHGRSLIGSCLATGFLAACPSVIRATFHDMQIEQVIGGVHGNTAVQAIQLRMSSAGQNLVSLARVVVRDAAGLNPIIVHNMTTNVVSGAGRRILIATGNLPSFTNPPLTPDFVITNPIPPSYLAAGTLTFESDSGIVYWRLSWGGLNYTGTGSVNLFNDADGNANPPFPSPLPKCTDQALQFRFASTANSTNNANDYQLTPGPAQLTKNNLTSAMVIGPPPPTGACCVGMNNCLVHSACVCGDLGGTYRGDGVPCVPDPCFPDCNGNGIADDQELPGNDCDENSIPDDCEACGDLDDDQDVDGDDFTAFLLAFGSESASPSFEPCTDFDSDGLTTFVDYQSWLACYRDFVANPSAPAPMPSDVGDLNADGLLNGLDIQAFVDVILHPGQAGFRSRLIADLDGDGAASPADIPPLATRLIGVVE